MKTLAFAFIFTVAASVAMGQVAEPAPVAQPAPTAPKPYQLKSRSSFKIPAGTRAPFIPIGWVNKDDQQAVVVVADDNVNESAFRVTTILLGNPSLAVINGQSYQEGEYLRMPRNGPQLRILVQRIDDGQVWLKHENKLFASPLKRSELGGRSIQEPLLNAERYIVPMPATPKPVPSPAPKLKP